MNGKLCPFIHKLGKRAATNFHTAKIFRKCALNMKEGAVS